jgi:two-component system NtrC family response regulator
MAHVLIIDDDKEMCKMLADMVTSMEHNAAYAYSIKDGLNEASSEAFDIVFLDVKLPDGNGLELLPTIRKTEASPEVIIITGAGDPDGAEIAIKNGAWDYIQKPLSPKKIILPLTRVLQYRDDLKKAKKPAVALKLDGMVGSSPQWKSCLDLLAQIANSDANVLISGETGTGKELFARAIHNNSSRARKNMVVVDCAALPENLVESMLFGHEKGAYTGADKERVGFIKEAHGSTLFLDEVGELPLPVQKAFLRVLQEHQFMPLGSRKEIESDFRLVAATNRDLERMVESKQFRQDLFFRLQSLTIEIPPLRARPQDIKDLAMNYVAKLCERYGTASKGCSPDFFEALAAYEWPGNVRELIHTIERVLALARFEPTLFPRHLPSNIRIHAARASVSKNSERIEVSQQESDSTQMLPRLQDIRETALFNVEKQYLKDLMLLIAWDIKEACRISGLSRSRLYHLLKKYKINKS